MTGIILLAEDLQDDEVQFIRVLNAARVQNRVVSVRDGEEVLAYFKGQGAYADRDKFPIPAVLFLDLRMTRLDGREVLKWLKQNPVNKMLIVVLTHLDDTRELNNAYALGAHSFLVKPFNREDLESLVSHFPGYWQLPPGITPGQNRPKSSPISLGASGKRPGVAKPDEKTKSWDPGTPHPKSGSRKS